MKKITMCPLCKSSVKPIIRRNFANKGHIELVASCEYPECIRTSLVVHMNTNDLNMIVEHLDSFYECWMEIHDYELRMK